MRTSNFALLALIILVVIICNGQPLKLNVAPELPSRQQQSDSDALFTHRKFDDDDDDDILDTETPPVENPKWNKKTSSAVHATHASLMALTFLIVFPIGSMASHFRFPDSAKVPFHVSFQLTGLVFILLGFVLGCWLAVGTGKLWMGAHQRLGTGLVIVVLIQPLLGLLHNHHYRKSKQRTFRWMIHTWFGRVIMILGIINGGLGFRLSSNYSLGALIVYICVAVLMSIMYVSVVCTHVAKKRRVAKRAAWWEETHSKPNSTRSTGTSKDGSRHELRIQPEAALHDHT